MKNMNILHPHPLFFSFLLVQTFQNNIREKLSPLEGARKKWQRNIKTHQNQARVQGGGPMGLAPPLEIEKPSKKKKVIRANFKLFHIYFATFLV